MVTAADSSSLRDRANQETFERLVQSDPVLVDIRRAGEIVPGLEPNVVLTSGVVMDWDEYGNGQRNAVIGGALFEGLADTPEDADRKIRSGDIIVDGCHPHGCVGSLAGIYTASMPVFVVEDRRYGTKGFCNFYEGPSHKRLNYGVYDQEVDEALRFIERVIAPTMAEALKRSEGGIPLRPLMKRAVHMGDELHSRNTAATLLFIRELFPHLLNVYVDRPDDVSKTLQFMSESDYFFLRLGMAAGKATADAAHGVEGSSVCTAMTFSSKYFSIRVGGLRDAWFSAPLEPMQAKLFDGFTEEDIEFMGGESPINETVGLGGFAQAAAFALQVYQGGSPQDMIQMNENMYRITVGEHEEFKIPYFRYRGTPTGIDVFKVVETSIQPVMDIGVAGRGGGQIGAGIMRAPLACFESAAEAYTEAYPNAAATTVST
ncbi:MAG: DUF1116 domain-containing protein [Actinobacteria bacterium]|nr:DUF1116 domain-containing protein [Actinomycetota bacterium]